ncbi:amphiphysin isoform X2 [Amblyomma americanum]
MADGKGGSFTKVVQKHAGRAKERILQNLGRADKTKDEVFEVYLYNFTRQQTAAAKLQKEFKNYVLCIKSLQLASKALMDTLSEIYEQEWVGHEQIPVKAQTLELLWDDYHRKMNDQVMIPLNSYINQFADVRGRIAKRGRKLVDYDKSRHSVESLRNSAKKKDDYKLGKAREELEEAKQMYEVINNELHEELPALYDSRIPFLVSNLQTFFTAESTFHAENAKVFSFLVETMQKLASSEGQASTKTSPLSYNLPKRYSSATRIDSLSHNADLTTAHFRNHTVGVGLVSLQRSQSDRREERPSLTTRVDGALAAANDTNDYRGNARSGPPNHPPRRFSSSDAFRQWAGNRAANDLRRENRGNQTSDSPQPRQEEDGDLESSRAITAQYARIRRHLAQGPDHPPKRPASVDCGPKYYRRSVERGGNLLERRQVGGSFISLSAADSRGPNRPVELYLVVRPPTGARPPQPPLPQEAPPLEPSSVSKEADTRPYEEIEFKKDPQCVACGTSSRMKCIWLNDAEFSFLRYQPWQCLRCAVNHSFEAAHPGGPAPRRNLCIWFTRVTRLKANYTELQCKMVAGAEAARLENEDSALVSPPGFRASYVGSDRNGEMPHHRRDEKDYEPVDVGAQMNSDGGDKPAAAADELYDIPVGATTTDLPAGVLYRVRATYKYTAEDVDELNFESGEIIRVIEYDDPEEQEEGWLMGIKESTGEKGLFPANFTRPI